MWKEQFERIFTRKDLSVDGQSENIQAYIATQIIEVIINEIPDNKITADGTGLVKLDVLKQRLREKWLN